MADADAAESREDIIEEENASAAGSVGGDDAVESLAGSVRSSTRAEELLDDAADDDASGAPQDIVDVEALDDAVPASAAARTSGLDGWLIKKPAAAKKKGASQSKPVAPAAAAAVSKPVVKAEPSKAAASKKKARVWKFDPAWKRGRRWLLHVDGRRARSRARSARSTDALSRPAGSLGRASRPTG